MAKPQTHKTNTPHTHTTTRQELPTESELLVDSLPTDQEAPPAPEVLREKVFLLDPMSVEEALEQVWMRVCDVCVRVACVWCA